MKANNVTELNDQQLAVLANKEHDPHALLKMSGKRQLAAVFSIMKEPPNRYPSDLEQTRAKVKELENTIIEAQYAHDKKFGIGRTESPQIQESLQRLARLRADHHLFSQHVKDMERAIEDRKQRGLV